MARPSKRRRSALKGWETRRRNARSAASKLGWRRRKLRLKRKAAANRAAVGKYRAKAKARSVHARKAAQTRHAKTASKGAPRLPGYVLRFLTVDRRRPRLIDVWPPDKHDRSRVGFYWNAVGVYRDTGKASALKRFAVESIYDAIRGVHLPFITDLGMIDKAILAGLTDFDDLYVEATWAQAAA